MDTTLRLVMTICAVSVSTSALAIDHTKDSLATTLKNVQQGKAVLVDVRELGEWKDGHLRDATHVALSELRRSAGSDEAPAAISKRIPKKKIVYCHCGAGVRVLPAGKILKKWGFDVRPLKAGYGELVEAGFREAK